MGAAGDPQAEQPHDAALEQGGTRPPLQRKTDDRQRDSVIGRIAQKIESVRAQAHGTGDKAGDDLDEEHRDIDAERRPQNSPIAGVGIRRVANRDRSSSRDDLISRTANVVMGSSIGTERRPV